MPKQKTVLSDLNSPDHLLTFDEIIQKGYNSEDERNERVSICITHYPLSLYVAYKYIIQHSDDYVIPGRIRYISDVQVFSTKLGFASVQENTKYKKLIEIYSKVSESGDFFVQDALENASNFTFTNTKNRKRSIKTLYHIKDEIERMSNVLGIYPSSLIPLISIVGLKSAKLPDKTKESLLKEYEQFLKYIDFVSSKYQTYSLRV